MPAAFGSPGDVRHPEAARLRREDVDREDALRAELVAHPPTAAQVRDSQNPQESVSRATATRPSEPDWRRDGVALPARITGKLLVRFVRRTGGRPTRLAVGLIGANLGKMVRTSAGMTALLDGVDRVAMEPPARASRQRSHKDTMCINCGCVGHFRSMWEAPSQCPTTIAYLGYETERGSFYFVDAEIEEEVPRPHLASVTLAPEQVLPPGFVILADLIRADLAAYISDFRDSEFMWEVTQTAPLVFSVPFPSAELLRLCSHDFICCPTNEFLISVHAAKAEPELVPPLGKVWVLIYGLPRGGPLAPRGGKLTHIVKPISESMGKPLIVDLASFEDDGP
ncbi:hypothetical protein ZWY2020_059534 [Hordeum vulgare]|nr:hypothetical protein ZWY2020_059534 [Hordeum vulgare]